MGGGGGKGGGGKKGKRGSVSGNAPGHGVCKGITTLTIALANRGVLCGAERRRGIDAGLRRRPAETAAQLSEVHAEPFNLTAHNIRTSAFLHRHRKRISCALHSSQPGS